ncbi:TraB/VirB10 family protein [Bathymodiolus thermophilus thioautotrophic gill symbiont]|uniref:Conjugal transfer protein TraB n=1 Tax=Bathymodiolus thermophilus thioautotrophic gill symbiont TaxID=2360 RepID=A0A1J5TXV3_9GAMM|nr:TraB/VirB10 family protein [Bathymodiolus thermophilus thioautotrophic gill symbiont]OIR25632.1 hypothetical protein BGC33_13735 [Bathymodiolus thermophilus thioautotrophic gill symbiont]
MNKFKEKYKKLEKTTQLRIKQAIIVIVVAIVLLLSYANKTKEKEQKVAQENTKKDFVINTDSVLFEDDISDALDEKLRESQEIIKQQTKDIEQLKELFLLQTQDNQQANSKEKEVETKKSIQSFPPIPGMNNDYSQNTDLLIQPRWIGGIVHEEYEAEEEIAKSKQDSQKKRIIKLPPSFMKGFLLTGMDAMTIEGSNDTPEPMMIRVQAPAMLPNDVKANLKGCFVVAEGYGNLATHRVDARLRSLSCINLKGNSVIFEKIKGYVQDGDGKRGIKGVPVHRAGALIARSMIAGAFEGIGNAITGSAQTTSISALGNTNSTPSSNLSKAALGGGISAGAKDVRSLFLQLAKQSSPIIEIGAAKKISVVITELVELKIQEL